MVVSCHPPKHQQMEEFDCWAIHCFVHITEAGEEEEIFLHRLVVMATILEKMAGHNKTPTILRNHEEMRKISLQRLCACWRQQQVQSNGDEEDLVRNIVPGMVDDNN